MLSAPIPPLAACPSRRRFLKSCAGIIPLSLSAPLWAAEPKASSSPAESYETHAKGIRILPGQWRPHYPWEHIAWISPAWPSQDYLWFDFPEAIFIDKRLLFLSHINPPLALEYPDLPRVPWKEVPQGIEFQRTLPNGLAFGGRLTRATPQTVDCELQLKNGTQEPLRRISLQTCLFLRAIREFADYTRDNKFIHHPTRGWLTLPQAGQLAEETAPYRLGWRHSGKRLADFPVMVTLSNRADRLVAMTWFEDTLSLVANPNHPCMHADPQFKDLAPGESATVRGRIAFFEGKLPDFDVRKFLAR